MIDTNFKVGDKVVPLTPINYYGKTLKQYDSFYVITQIVDDKVTLMSNGQIWGTFSISNLKLV